MSSNLLTKAQQHVDIQKKQFRTRLFGLSFLVVICFITSICVGRAGIANIVTLFRTITGEADEYLQMLRIMGRIRIPRALAAFLVGSSLAVCGLVYQNTFNNKLVSPDILGVSSGCCVGAGVAILLGFSPVMIRLVAFGVGVVTVFVAVALPKVFRNHSPLMLVLSGIIVGSFMDSIIAFIKYVADKNDKLSEITFWMMGSLVGIQFEDLGDSFLIYIIPLIILIVMAWKINIISLGVEEADSLGINYKRDCMIVIICATFLTANCVSISGSIGWIGLVIPHIARAFAGNDARKSLPMSAICGGLFLMIVDTLSRLVSVNEVPLSIITGLIGAAIYTVVLAKRGRYISE